MIAEDSMLKSPVESEPRIEQWKRKLLDLSLRNPLLNTRIVRGTGPAHPAP